MNHKKHIESFSVFYRNRRNISIDKVLEAVSFLFTSEKNHYFFSYNSYEKKAVLLKAYARI